MKRSIIPMLALAVLASCGGGKAADNNNNTADNSQTSQTAAESKASAPAQPSKDDVLKLWDGYMEDASVRPTVWAEYDIDKDGTPEYIYWQKDQPIIAVCTYDASEGLRLVAANNFEPKEMVIVSGAGIREGLATMQFQQESMAVIKNSKLDGIYYWSAEVDEEPSKFYKADAIRTQGKEISKADFEAATKAFENAANEVSLDNIQWKEWK